MPSRRRILRVSTLGVALGVAGCLGDGGAAGDGARSPTGSPGDTPSANEASETPPAVPEDCPPPTFDDVPALPDSRTKDTMARFVRQFERAYQDHALPEDERLADVDVDGVRTAGDGHVIELRCEAAEVTPVNGTATATAKPQDALEWKATYRVRDATVQRTLIGIAGGRELDTTCWKLDRGDADQFEMPADCPSPPSIDGVPALPEERTDTSTSTFVTEFERAYKGHVAPEDRRVDTVDVVDADQAGDGYRVRLEVSLAPVAPGDDETPSPMPTDTGLFLVTYRIQGSNLHREESGFASYDSTEDCWDFAKAD